VESIRSIVWIGAQRDVAELAADRPTLDIVWESDAEGARRLPLADFDALILACDGPDHAITELATLSGEHSLPPVLVQLNSSEGSSIREILARGASDVLTRGETDVSSYPTHLLARLEGLPGLGATAATRERALNPTKLRVARPKNALAKQGRPMIIGDSPQMTEVLTLIEHASRSSVTALLMGETGTGKELLARAIHSASPRVDAPFVAFNCAAFPDTLLESELFGHVRGSFTGADRNKVGLFEHANGGTLFLDEIGETSKSFQVKLLRVLQEREARPVGSTKTRSVNARVIAATNRDLRREATQARFRVDLYYRLAVFPIQVPPLRERPADILPLSEYFLELHAARNGQSRSTLSKEASRLLQSYAWPGNVRELENEIQRALAMTESGRILTPAQFSERLHGILEPIHAVVEPGETLRETMGRIEAWLIRRTLDSYQGHRTNTARGLGITREGLYKKMKRHGIT
jgi:transcriptional regulator with PAS, ATPase and Fis domain